MHYDPPEHTAYRKAINPSFRKDRLVETEPELRRVAAALVGAAVEAGSADGFVDLASPLCARSVIILLHVPEELAGPMIEHTTAFEHAQFSFDAERVEAENLLLYELARRLVAHRRLHPLDPDEDVVSGLLRAGAAGDDGTVAEAAAKAVEEAGGSGPVGDVPIDEVVAGGVRQLLVAGHGAPALAMASAIAHLAGDPDLQARLRSDPSLVPPAVEELLRLHTPNQGFARTTTRDVELGGRTIPAGELVAIPYTSANRDEAVFDRPDELVLGRTERHVAFGLGVHVCPGSHVGRRQTCIVLEELLARTSRFEIAGEVAWAPFPVHGPMRLPLTLVPRHGGHGRHGEHRGYGRHG